MTDIEQRHYKEICDKIVNTPDYEEPKDYSIVNCAQACAKITEREKIKAKIECPESFQERYKAFEDKAVWWCIQKEIDLLEQQLNESKG